MSVDQVALNHLLDGRAVLRREIDRLYAAVADLDVVIDRLRSGHSAEPDPAAPTASVASAPAESIPAGPVPGGPSPAVPAPAEPAPARSATRSNRSTRTQAKRPPRARPTAAAADGKSIRSRVLDMLSAEDRDFPLTEIIDRVRAAGVQAHDDAVRSITVKLMRDGQLERVGRGQYRFARSNVPTESVAEPVAEPQSQVVVEPARYTPPLNLSQPWNGTAAD